MQLSKAQKRFCKHAWQAHRSPTSLCQRRRSMQEDCLPPRRFYTSVSILLYKTARHQPILETAKAQRCLLANSWTILGSRGVMKSKSIELDCPNSKEFSAFLSHISIFGEDSEVISDLRTNHTEETRLRLRIPNSSLTFVQTRADCWSFISKLQHVKWIFEQNIVRSPSQNCKLHWLSKNSEVFPELRSNQALRQTSSEFKIAFRTVETRHYLTIPKSYLTFVQIRADTESKYDRKN